MANLVEYPMKKTPTARFGLLHEFSIEPEYNNGADWTNLCHCATTPAFSEADRLELAKLVEPWMRTIVEIGVSRDGWENSSTKVLIDNKHEDCIYLGIDLEDRNFILDQGTNVNFVQRSSYDVDENLHDLKKLGTDKIDLLFIDGDHSVNSLIKEWEYAKFVSEGGIIVLHDTNFHPGPWCLTRSVDPELFEVTYLLEQMDDYGMAVLRRK
jgi:cephalosporin hydroxylase